MPAPSCLGLPPCAAGCFGSHSVPVGNCGALGAPGGGRQLQFITRHKKGPHRGGPFEKVEALKQRRLLQRRQLEVLELDGHWRALMNLEGQKAFFRGVGRVFVRHVNGLHAIDEML